MSKLFKNLTLLGVAITTFTLATAPAASAGTAQAPASTSSSAEAGSTAAKIAAENPALIRTYTAKGAKVSADGKNLRFPDGAELSLAPAALTDCPSGWVCLFAALNYGGRMLKWSDPGTRADLSSYGFNDELSSWANKGPYDARWFYAAAFGGTTRCMGANTRASYVGDSDNDEASSFAIYTDSLAC